MAGNADAWPRDLSCQRELMAMAMEGHKEWSEVGGEYQCARIASRRASVGISPMELTQQQSPFSLPPACVADDNGGVSQVSSRHGHPTLFLLDSAGTPVGPRPAGGAGPVCRALSRGCPAAGTWLSVGSCNTVGDTSPTLGCLSRDPWLSLGVAHQPGSAKRSLQVDYLIDHADFSLLGGHRTPLSPPPTSGLPCPSRGATGHKKDPPCPKDRSGTRETPGQRSEVSDTGSWKSHQTWWLPPASGHLLGHLGSS